MSKGRRKVVNCMLKAVSKREMSESAIHWLIEARLERKVGEGEWESVRVPRGEEGGYLWAEWLWKF